jgi:8-oxo-dGTP diphosphatase
VRGKKPGGAVIEREHTAIESTASLPGIDLSIRVVPFAIGDLGLDVALVQSTHGATLPAGTLAIGETLADAASRVARAALTAAPDYLEQLYTFSIAGHPGQVVVAYFALVSADTRRTVELHRHAQFQHVDRAPAVSDVDFGILEYAKTRLRAKLAYSNVGFYLLPREFTLSELQDVYESVIGRPLDKRNFRRRVLASGFIEPIGEKRPTNHRPAALYRFAGEDPATGALTPTETDWSK